MVLLDPSVIGLLVEGPDPPETPTPSKHRVRLVVSPNVIVLLVPSVMNPTRSTPSS